MVVYTKRSSRNSTLAASCALARIGPLALRLHALGVEDGLSQNRLSSDVIEAHLTRIPIWPKKVKNFNLKPLESNITSPIDRLRMAIFAGILHNSHIPWTWPPRTPYFKFYFLGT
jgi:hypothetical protein